MTSFAVAVAAVTTFVKFAPKPNGAIGDVVLGSAAAVVDAVLDSSMLLATCGAAADAVWMVDVADISDVSGTDASDATDCVWVADVAECSDVSGPDASDAADVVGATADVGVDVTAALRSSETTTSNIYKHMRM